MQLADVEKTFDVLLLFLVIWMYYYWQTNHRIKITLRDLILRWDFCLKMWLLVRYFAIINILRFILIRFVVLVYLPQFKVNFILQRFHFKRFVLNGISLAGQILLTRIFNMGKSGLAFSENWLLIPKCWYFTLFRTAKEV